ncbi:hypothetical protein [Naasia lichenicola]|uniref:Uncharacterized protein n=1 Tax=Naasia lichenicola TaxID=2565933 RepID=A0A4V3WTH0_9MICO|nr:hypothetical protein [Naasia lichenicola]THG30670.1 hypothetical protein E6C64_08500 [Naasia lichenicola]THG31907.1 hypothetical protein E6C64_07645 [Naasia lichenicola]
MSEHNREDIGYSGRDIMDKLVALTINQEVLMSDVAEIKTQTYKTNGRVNKLERSAELQESQAKWQEDYMAKHPTIQNIKAENLTVQRKWYDNKDLVKAAGIITAGAAGIITFFIGSGAAR